MNHADDSVDGEDERDASARIVQLGRPDDLPQDGVDLFRSGDRQNDLLFRLDRHAEDLVVFVDPGPAPEEHGAAWRAGFDRRLEDRAPPALPNGAR
jgi:hypothetical protein